MQTLDAIVQSAVDLAWGLPLVLLLIVGGLALTIYSRFVPLRRGWHAVQILTGRFDKADDPGQITHFQALATALAATIGVGNIGGVAIALTQGGPGAVFWMWVAAAVGMTTKFFDCTLSQLYRAPDEKGVMQGGAMYTIEVGLGRRWKPLAVLFATFGMIGCLPMFQTNQVAEILALEGIAPWVTASAATALVALVAFGGVERIGTVTARLVPAMCVLYLLLALAVLVIRIEAVPRVFSDIFSSAFTGRAAVGGAAGLTFIQVVLIGVKRGAFSNEAGIGTATLAHGAARTKEPVREGLVAMLGPFIDTILVCSLTAFVILVAVDPSVGDVAGVSLTAQAFAETLGPWAQYALILIVLMFALSTMISYSYYGKKCFGYLFGARRANLYTWFYLVGLFLGGVWSAALVINVIDTAFALMAFPNMIATLILAPKVIAATRDYFERARRGETH
ncbi:MAG: alanine:cation symporter family protein [Acidobacteria bacterium]|nr:MAG: alanine:cation symporter family protein [Acidobacteriota bacterium]REK00244.1 MAG: alanine:cation symporter family protein [Acidobacteriota bacterium]